MKTTFLVLLWLLLAFGLIVSSEHFWAMNPVLLWVSLVFLFLMAATFARAFDPEAKAARARWEAQEANKSAAGVSQASLASYAESIAPYMTVTGWKVKGPGAQFEGKLKTAAPLALAGLTAAFQPHGLSPLLLGGEEGEVQVVLLPGLTETKPRRMPRWWLHGLLFFLTFVTTTWAGGLQQGIDLWHEPGRFASGLPYSVALLAILGAHEFGHYFAARYHDVDVTPPYFVPVPFGLGTFGAFIRIRGLAEDRRSIFDVAVAGPLAGLVLAVPALLIGLKHSIVIAGTGSAGMGANGIDAGSSLLLACLAKLSLGSALTGGHHVILHPLAFAGWIGLLVTALNLLPIGQLDGGHLAHALFGSRKGHTISVVALVALFLLAFFVWPNLMAWAFIVFFVAGTRDIPPRNDITPLTMPRMLLGLFAFAVLLSILLPVPYGLYHSVGGHGRYF